MSSESLIERCKRLEKIGKAASELLLRLLRAGGREEFFNHACTHIKSALEVELCKILRYEPERDEFLLISGHGFGEGVVGKEVVRGYSKAHHTLQEGKPVYSEDVSSEKRFEVPDFIKRHEVVSGLSVPIHFENGVWGVLGVYSKDRRRFNEEEVKFLEAVASSVSAYLEKSELLSELSKEKHKLELLLTYLKDVISIIDREGRVRYKSPSVEHVFGWEPKELIGKPFHELIHPADLEHLLAVKERVFLNPEEPISIEYRFKSKTEGYRWVEATFFLPAEWEKLGLEGAIVSERDVTERKSSQEKVLKMSYFDLLTGLPNRFLFLQKLEELIKSAERRNELVGVVVIDIANFKEINDVYGIDTGDAMLSEIAHRLVNKLRSGDVVSRFFSDEFGVILPNIKTATGLNKALEKIRASFDEPLKHGETNVLLKANMGVAVFPRDGRDAGTLLRKAELALSKAKDSENGGIHFFSKDLEERIATIVLIKSRLHESIQNGEIFPYYQPIVKLKESKPIGMEALVRWRHPELGLISPSRFIQIAEDSGLILEIGEFIVDKALSDLSALQKRGFYDMYVAVNFSTKQFLDENLPDKIRHNLNAHGVEPRHFLLEITESTAMKEPARTGEVLEELRKLGIQIAIDDFGTGYSSMNYLIEFDVDKIKIDKSFTSAMLENPKAESVVKTIIDLSHSLGASALAEGIEKEEHLEKLKSLGCEEGQGYFFSPPVEFDKLENVLENIADIK